MTIIQYYFKSNDWEEVKMHIPTESSRMVRGVGKCISNTSHELFAKRVGQSSPPIGGRREPAPVIALVNNMQAVVLETAGGISSRRG